MIYQKFNITVEKAIVVTNVAELNALVERVKSPA